MCKYYEYASAFKYYVHTYHVWAIRNWSPNTLVSSKHMCSFEPGFIAKVLKDLVVGWTSPKSSQQITSPKSLQERLSPFLGTVLRCQLLDSMPLTHLEFYTTSATQPHLAARNSVVKQLKSCVYIYIQIYTYIQYKYMCIYIYMYIYICILLWNPNPNPSSLKSWFC